METMGAFTEISLLGRAHLHLPSFTIRSLIRGRK
jgi:hypothetical protein